MKMVDVHVLTHSGTRSDWLEQCLASLEHEPCNVHVLRGVEGHIGKGRAEGYARGSAPYVSLVDSDDYVLPGAFAACIAALEETQANAVVTYEKVMDEQGNFAKALKPNHNLMVARRTCISPLLPHLSTIPVGGGPLILRVLKPVQLNTVGYVWRLHRNGIHHRNTRESMKAEEERCPWQLTV